METIRIEVLLAAIIASAGAPLLIERRFLEGDYSGKALLIDPTDEGIVISLAEDGEYVTEISGEDSWDSSEQGVLGSSDDDGQVPGETNAGSDGGRGDNGSPAEKPRADEGN
jgi:hypothetical protein